MEIGAPSRVLESNQLRCSIYSPSCRGPRDLPCFSRFSFSPVNISKAHKGHPGLACLNKISKSPTHGFGSRCCTCKVTLKNTDTFMEEANGMPTRHTEEFELALSPLDGRYWNKVKELAPFLSEYGLIHFRVLVEIKWLLKLSQIPEVSEVPGFSKGAESYLQGLINEFSIKDFREVKNIEKVINHDVKAVEYFLKKKCESHPEIATVLEFFHFACTSEDINNLAYALLLRETINTIILPVMDYLITAISNVSKEKTNIPMFSSTHGQSPSTMTLGMELAIFATRLREAKQGITEVKMMGKFAGAVGNYNAHMIAYPDVNWPQIAEEFVTSLGLSFNPYVTQIESHDYMAKLFHAMIEFNHILIDFNRGIWSNISSGYFKQTTKAGEVGSSTMPHKVNPIDFENSEGNLGVANGGLYHLSSKLPNSRWQRDLTDSTTLRSIGEAFGHSLLAYKSALQGISKLKVNEARLNGGLNQSWEVLSEPTHTVNKITTGHANEPEQSWLTAFPPLNDPYCDEDKGLAPFLSEHGLIRFRVLFEIKWLLKLSQIPEVPEVPRFSEGVESYLQGLVDEFSMKDALEVKSVEKATNHEVNAVEYFLKKKCESNPKIAKVLDCFQFACTSREINNIAHALMLKETVNKVIFPVIDDLIMAMCSIARDNAHVPMLSRTHGQPASPTTLGKEMAIFAVRLAREKQEISQVKIAGKFAGPIGNYDAHLLAHPDVNWPQIAEEFVASLGLSFNPYMTRIEARDSMAKLFHSVIRFNNILINFYMDVRGYASLGYLKQSLFNSSEGNLGVANGRLSHLSMSLSLSRWQCVLSDSTVLRSMSEGLGHSLLAYKSAAQQIPKLQVDEGCLDGDLNQSWEVLAEAVQTVMRRYGIPEPYEKLKELTRGRAINREGLRGFVQELELPEEAKTSLLELTPQIYTGAAAHLVGAAVDFAFNSTNGHKAPEHVC